MTDATTLAKPIAAPKNLARPGRWCLAAGVIGMLQAAVILAWPHQVATARYSYPQDATWYVVAQATFFLQHLPLAVAVGALAGLTAVRPSRWARRGLLVGTVGLVLLAVLELVGMAAATTAETSTLGTTISSLYSIPVLLTGVGLTVSGLVLLRQRLVARPMAGVLTALGLFVFVGLGPVLATDSFVGARLAIMAWMLLFAVLGWLMQRSDA